MARVPATLLPLLLLAAACSAKPESAVPPPSPAADSTAETTLPDPAAEPAQAPDPAPAATPDPDPAAETAPVASEPDTPAAPAAESAERGTPEEMKKWAHHMGDIPFVIGMERGLAAAEATGKPVFLFYTATW